MRPIVELKRLYLQNNAIVRLIIINATVFVLVALVRLLVWISGNSSGGLDDLLNRVEMPFEPGQLLIQPWSLLTYAFLHYSPLHILLNMLMLFWFGSILGSFNTQKHIWTYYLAGAAAGAVLAMLSFVIFPVVRSHVSPPYYIYGASAAVMSIMVAAATQVPRYEINLAFLGPVRIVYVALVFLAIDLAGTPQGNAAGHISHFGGALAGFLMMRQQIRGRDLTAVFRKILNIFALPGKSRKRLKVEYRAHSKQKGDTLQTQEQVDAILEKISLSGYASLTQKEKEILFKASRND